MSLPARTARMLENENANAEPEVGGQVQIRASRGAGEPWAGKGLP